jgi:N-acyl-L-homoserine lactone synthetase
MIGSEAPMSLLIRPCHHHRFRAVLNDSFRLRGEVFDSALEDDGFDGNAALYLVNLDPVGQTIATVRISPGAASERGAGAVEMSRLCADPRLSREERRGTLLELRAAMALLFLRRRWALGVVVGHDRHIQTFVRSGMTVRPLGPPVLRPGDSQLSFAVLATDPDGPALAARGPPLQDPDEDPSLFTRYGDRAVA